MPFLFMIGFLVLGVVQLVAAGAWLNSALGAGFWFYPAMLVLCIVTLLFRFTPPLIILAFLGAMSVWHWHWALAALFAAPTLVIMIPALAADIIGAGRGAFRNRG